MKPFSGLFNINYLCYSSLWAYKYRVAVYELREPVFKAKIKIIR